MPITKKREDSYYDSKGNRHSSLGEAQLAELEMIFQPSLGSNGLTDPVESAVQVVLDNAEAVVAILTTGPTSRPSTRKRAGTSSPKRAAKRATEAQAKTGFKNMRQAADGTVNGTNATHDADVPAEPAGEAA